MCDFNISYHLVIVNSKSKCDTVVVVYHFGSPVIIAVRFPITLSIHLNHF